VATTNSYNKFTLGTAQLAVRYASGMAFNSSKWFDVGTQSTANSSEHRKKMAAAKDIWSSDSETEDEKLGVTLCMYHPLI